MSIRARLMSQVDQAKSLSVGIMQVLGSDKAVAAAKVVVAAVTLFQAVNALKASHRKIGFKK